MSTLRTLVSVAALILAPIGVASAATHTPAGPIHWFNGSVEDGLALAARSNKPVFLYWGAVWCPPCNQIKAVVFTSPEVGDLMKAVVPIYLDGDTERAQAWADKLHVGGYPTMLLLDSSGHELLRIGEFVDAAEFTTAVRTALTAHRGTRDAIVRALAGQASADDWTILTATGWDGPDAPDLLVRVKLFDAMPPDREGDRALLAAKILENAALTPQIPVIADAIHAHAAKLVDAMFAGNAAIYAARSTIVEESKQVVTFVHPDIPDVQSPSVTERWLAAAAWIGQQPNASLSTRMMSAGPEVELWLFEHPGQPVPADRLGRLHAAIAAADAKAVSPYERHAVISDAANLLSDAGDAAGAIALLKKELKTTDTPWYYHSDLADLEQKAGHNAEALKWSELGRKSAKGSATRLQWLVNDLALNTRLPGPDQAKRVASLLSEYYALAFKAPDGFSGRNAGRAHTVADRIRDLASTPQIQAVLTAASARCEKVRGAGGPNDCRLAFPPK